jgi:acetolactate synthase regulatory subunit
MPNTSLSLYVHAGTDALHRVVSVCRRRNIEILALTYSDNQISLTISGGRRQMRQIDRWLDALVDVFDVEFCDAPAVDQCVRRT